MIPALSLNVVRDVQLMLSYPFMVTALRAGTIVAIVAGVLGYLMVLRKEAFAGHTLSVLGFPGAAAAVWLGLPPAAGYYAACVAGAAVLAALPAAGGPAGGRRGGSGLGGRGGGGGRGGPAGGSAAVGTVQAVALGAGVLFVSLSHGFLSGLTTLLFGAIIGVTAGQVLALAVAGAVCLLVVAAMARPLLLASVDPAGAQARGVPVRALSGAFLVLLGLAAAGISQVTGSLLVFALLVAPPATALRITARPGRGALLSAALGVAVVWVGEFIAFYSPYPVGFWVTTLGFGGYLAAVTGRAAADRAQRRRATAAPPDRAPGRGPGRGPGPAPGAPAALGPVR